MIDKAAWSISHRIREPMKGGSFWRFGDNGKMLQAGETHHGKADDRTSKGNRRLADKRAVVSLVYRDGWVRSLHLARGEADTIPRITVANGHWGTHLDTNEGKPYRKIRESDKHARVNHVRSRYVKGDAYMSMSAGYASVLHARRVGSPLYRAAPIVT